MALSCKCLQIPLWSLCGQHIPRTESRVGGRKGTVKLFMNRILSFPAEVQLVELSGEGRGRKGCLPQEARAQGAGPRSPDTAGLGAGRARRAQPPPLPAHTDLGSLCSGRWALCNLFGMCHEQSFKSKVNPSHWSSYKTGSPFPIPHTNKSLITQTSPDPSKAQGCREQLPEPDELRRTVETLHSLLCSGLWAPNASRIRSPHQSSLTLLLQAQEPSHIFLLQETSENASAHSTFIFTTQNAGRNRNADFTLSWEELFPVFCFQASSSRSSSVQYPLQHRAAL